MLPPLKFLKTIYSEIVSEAVLATNTILPVCLLHVHMKAIAHANNWCLTIAFHIIFTWAPVNFTWAQARVCPGVYVVMPLSLLLYV